MFFIIINTEIFLKAKICYALGFIYKITVNVRSVRIVDLRSVDEPRNTDNNNDGNYNNGVLQGQNLISDKWYTAECWAEGASPKAMIEWSIDGNGTLAEEKLSPSRETPLVVVEVSKNCMLVKLYDKCNTVLLLLICVIFFFTAN